MTNEIIITDVEMNEVELHDNSLQISPAPTHSVINSIGRTVTAFKTRVDNSICCQDPKSAIALGFGIVMLTTMAIAPEVFFILGSIDCDGKPKIVHRICFSKDSDIDAKVYTGFLVVYPIALITSIFLYRRYRS